MTIYKHRAARSLKWLVALVVFILALTVTWSDVYGDETRDESARTDQTKQIDDKQPPQPESVGGDNGDTPPSTIPEPTTLILLGGGLGAMYLIRRRRQQAAK